MGIHGDSHSSGLGLLLLLPMEVQTNGWMTDILGRESTGFPKSEPRKRQIKLDC